MLRQVGRRIKESLDMSLTALHTDLRVMHEAMGEKRTRFERKLGASVAVPVLPV